MSILSCPNALQWESLSTCTSVPRPNFVFCTKEKNGNLFRPVLNSFLRSAVNRHRGAAGDGLYSDQRRGGGGPSRGYRRERAKLREGGKADDAFRRFSRSHGSFLSPNVFNHFRGVHLKNYKITAILTHIVISGSLGMPFLTIDKHCTGNFWS